MADTGSFCEGTNGQIERFASAGDICTQHRFSSALFLTAYFRLFPAIVKSTGTGIPANPPLQALNPWPVRTNARLTRRPAPDPPVNHPGTPVELRCTCPSKPEIPDAPADGLPKSVIPRVVDQATQNLGFQGPESPKKQINGKIHQNPSNR